jgi:hypothetical protein
MRDDIMVGRGVWKHCKRILIVCEEHHIERKREVKEKSSPKK